MLASTTSLKRMAAVALVAAGTMAAVPAQAAPIAPLALGKADPAIVQQVHYRGWGWGGAVAGGLIAGAIIGGAMSQPYYYSYPPDYYYGAPPVYVGPSDGVGYCMRRYKSYDPASGTYLGYDGYRHPCP
jgi:hypothetical protein